MATVKRGPAPQSTAVPGREIHNGGGRTSDGITPTVRVGGPSSWHGHGRGR